MSYTLRLTDTRLQRWGDVRNHRDALTATYANAAARHHTRLRNLRAIIYLNYGVVRGAFTGILGAVDETGELIEPAGKYVHAGSHTHIGEKKYDIMYGNGLWMARERVAFVPDLAYNDNGRYVGALLGFGNAHRLPNNPKRTGVRLDELIERAHPHQVPAYIPPSVLHKKKLAALEATTAAQH
jgi:hypothetical protein